jgi:sugar phosphate isomerase/epimerase
LNVAKDLSLQLYSLKEQSLKDPEAMLSGIRALGFGAVETAGDYDWDLEKWRDQLEMNGLILSSAHVIMERLEAELPTLAEFNAELGNHHLIVPMPPDGEGVERYYQCAKRLNDIAMKAQAFGCHVSYHNHHWEFEALPDGQRGIDILLTETDPDLVKFQVDTAWALAGGGDVLEFLKTNRERVRCLHAKEYGIAEKDEPTMGSGDVPFPTILEMAVEEGWQLTVEHEPGDHAPEGVRASASYLQNTLLEMETR